jgi:FdrA protein
MVVRAALRRSTYHDSMALMRLAESLRALPGVREAAALMGTPANREMLAGAELSTPEVAGAGPGDLVLAVRAESPAQAEAALASVDELLQTRSAARSGERQASPRTLDGARRRLPDASLVSISVPGAYATLLASRALRRGLHVFLFSDNIPLADEIMLKRLARQRRLLCMGPDCGTAYLAGAGLGFASVVPAGRIGCVAASGTGLQAVAAHLSALSEGLSHGIGVGGRDLSAEVGGVMTTLALEMLAADPATEVIVVVSKPPAGAVLPALETAARATGKPVVLCCLGAPQRPGEGPLWVGTLEDAAAAAAALASGRPWRPREFTDPEFTRRHLAADGAPRRRLLGLYTGGTLAHEARVLLEPLVGAVGALLNHAGHRIVDLGEDEFTLGRLHPMLDPAGRAALVREAGQAGDADVLLLDLVLGRAAHADPAGPLVAAIDDARRAAKGRGRTLAVIASVVGTVGDPQNSAAQRAALEAAGAVVFPSNAQAARFAALLLDRRLEGKLLSGAAPERPVAPSAPSPRPASGAATPIQAPRVINVGLEVFADELQAQAVPVVHVDWRPPPVDAQVVALLARLDDDVELEPAARP